MFCCLRQKAYKLEKFFMVINSFCCCDQKQCEQREYCCLYNFISPTAEEMTRLT